jgi:hypothetical protein
MVKATEDPTNTSSTPQSAELSGLARRLHARAESVLLRDQPEQQSDMRTAARFLEELIRLRSEIAAARTALDATIAAIKTTLKCEIVINVRDGGVVAIENLPPGLTVIVRTHDVEAPKVVETYWRQDPADAPEPTDLFVDITGDDGTSRRNVPLREAVGNDPAEYEDCRQTLLGDGHCTIGGGEFPLHHLELVGNDVASVARAIDKLVAGIRKAIESTTDPVCRNHLRELLGEG